MTNHLINTTAGCTLVVITIPTSTIENTVAIALIGAVTSFVASLIMKEVWSEFLAWKNKKK